jgi:hypothetical protein
MFQSKISIIVSLIIILSFYFNGKVPINYHTTSYGRSDIKILNQNQNIENLIIEIEYTSSILDEGCAYGYSRDYNVKCAELCGCPPPDVFNPFNTGCKHCCKSDEFYCYRPL